MKKVLLAAVLGMTAGCSGVLHPSALGPRHHNIQATFIGHPEGPVIWLCATQPRTYTNPYTGESHEEEDHYLQYTECPVIPVE